MYKTNFNYEVKTRLKKRVFNPTNDLRTESTIYSNTHDKNTTAYIMLSGAGTLELQFYLLKTLDLIYDKKRDWYIYENKNTLSWCCIDSIIDWVKHDLLSKYKHIVFMGFSNGGIISSHVLHTLTRLSTDVKFSMITIDTPFSLNKMLEFYEDNFTYYRNDMTVCYIPTVIKSIQRNCKGVELSDFWISDYETFERFIERIYGLKQSDMRGLGSLTYDLPNCNIFRIYSNNDPLVMHQITETEHILHSTPQVRHILFDKLTHNTQMFSHPKKFTKLMNKLIASCEK